MTASTAQFAACAAAFRRFFSELEGVFLERETLLAQIELALLSREHVLVIGPPGTAKSAVAAAVLGRIVDDRTGLPSLFSRQLSESTVQSDLIGPVDFKVLTETGRTEYLVEDGMLGAAHAFIDEVFDGRDMLLRSILNVLHERELKHGRKVTAGQCECAIMTSNRYLSEVLARSPDLLLAFADRLSYIAFCPKSFARASSRASMLAQASERARRPVLRADLRLQQLDVLQEAVDQVEVPGALTEGIERLGDELERGLQTYVAKLPDYVPTKYFSQRTLVKAVGALKAAVVRDRIFLHPERPFRATPDDLDALRYFFVLGGPPASEVDALLRSCADPRERAQLEIVRIEQRVFDDSLAKAKEQLGGGKDREAAGLGAQRDREQAEALSRTFDAGSATALANTLRTKLVPGPRYAENRADPLASAQLLAESLESPMARVPGGQGLDRAAFQDAVEAVVGLVCAVPELVPLGPRLVDMAAAYVGEAAALLAQRAEGVQFEEAVGVEALATEATSLGKELGQLARLAEFLAGASVPVGSELPAKVREARVQAAEALRAQCRAFTTLARSPQESGFATESKTLLKLDQALALLEPGRPGVRVELLEPFAHAMLKERLSKTPFRRVEELAREVQLAIDVLRREGLPVGALVRHHAGLLEGRVRDHARGLGSPARAALPNEAQCLDGTAYKYYRQQLGAWGAAEGELSALSRLEQVMGDPPGGFSFPEETRNAVAAAELGVLVERARYLHAWMASVRKSLPELSALKGQAEIERAFDRLIRSRFPQLVTREGELVRLSAALERMAAQGRESGDFARKTLGAVRALAEDFGEYAHGLLRLRAGR